MKYENIFPTGILVHDVPVWVANQVEKLVEERVDKLQRPDDNEETVRKRLAIYHDQTSPLVDFYKKSSLVQNGNKYIEVNGVGDISTIQEQIKKAL